MVRCWGLSCRGRGEATEVYCPCCGAAAWPLAARAQSERTRRIGILSALGENDPEGQARVAALLRELQRLGWSEGRNVRVEYRWGTGDADRMRRDAAELVALVGIEVGRAQP